MINLQIYFVEQVLIHETAKKARRAAVEADTFKSDIDVHTWGPNDRFPYSAALIQTSLVFDLISNPTSFGISLDSNP